MPLEVTRPMSARLERRLCTMVYGVSPFWGLDMIRTWLTFRPPRLRPIWTETPGMTSSLRVIDSLDFWAKRPGGREMSLKKCLRSDCRPKVGRSGSTSSGGIGRDIPGGAAAGKKAVCVCAQPTAGWAREKRKKLLSMSVHLVLQRLEEMPPTLDRVHVPNSGIRCQSRNAEDWGESSKEYMRESSKALSQKISRLFRCSICRSRR
eukprot:09876_1